MKKGGDFENGLKDKLANHNSSMDLETEWAALEARRSKKRKRPFWLWLGMLACVLVALSWFTINNLSSEVEQTKLSDDSQSSERFDTPISVQGISSPSAIIAKPSFLEKQEKDLKPVQKSNISSPKKPLTYAPKKPNTINQKIVNLKSAIESKNPIQSIVLPNPSSVENETISTSKNNEINKHQIVFEELAMLPFKQAILEATPFDLDLSTKRYHFRKNTINWSLTFQTGYGKTFRRFEAIDSNKEAFVKRRQDREQLLDSWQTAIKLRRHLPQNWFLEVGLVYDQATDQFEDTQITNTITELDEQIVSIIVRDDGSEEHVYGSVDAEVNTTTKGIYYHYHQGFSTQLSAGKNISLGKKIGFNLSAGLSYSLFSRKNGTAFSDEDAMVYTDLKNSLYRKSGLINGLGAIEFYVQANKAWQFSIGLQGSQQLNNSFLKESGILEKRSMVGMQLGVRKMIRR